MRHMTVGVRTLTREELIDVTAPVADAIRSAGVGDGILTVFVPHTTAAVTVNENADPAVQSDMLRWLARLIPPGSHFEHDEGNSDAHLKASLVGPSLQIPFLGGELQLGRWQGIYFCEFDGPRPRTLELYFD